MNTRRLTKLDVESARGEIFHMIIFAMAWVMIGEYALDFSDYVIPAIIILIAVVVLALYSIRLYELEDLLPAADLHIVTRGKKQKRRAWLYALILIFEGIAVMVTWMFLIRLGYERWLVPGFAFVAGLHFFPLAAVIRVKSYYWLGLFICALSVFGYWLMYDEKMPERLVNAMVSYGCAIGAVIDGDWMVARIKRRVG